MKEQEEIQELKELKLKDQKHKKREEELILKENELKLKNLEEQKIFEKRIAEEKRTNEENERIKQWEKKFDSDLAKKEEELIKKFYSDQIKEVEVIKEDN